MSAAKTFETRLYEPGDIIMAQGEEGGDLSYIMKGKVEVVKRAANGREEVVATLATGDVLGEMALLTRQPRNASVRALDKTWIIQVGERTFQKALVNEDLPIMKDMVSQLARRLQELEAKNLEYLGRIRDLERRLEQS